MSERKLEVDSLRGIACILVVGFHAFGSIASYGLLNENLILEKIILFLTFLRMPLFTFLGGYVYSIRPLKEGSFKKYFKGKFNRLIIPAIFVGLPTIIIQYFFGGSHNYIVNDLLLYPITPLGVFWYLHAMLIIFILIGLLDYFDLIKSNLNLLIFFAISLILYFFKDLYSIKFMALGKAIYLLPFFVVGMIIERNKGKIVGNIKFIIYLIGFLSIFYIIRLIFLGLEEVNKLSIENAILSIIICIFVFNLKIKIKFLAYIGVFSYSIYLFHSLLVSFPRILLSKMGYNIDYPLLVILFATLIGVFCPIFVDKMLSRNKISSFLFLGKNIK